MRYLGIRVVGTFCAILTCGVLFVLSAAVVWAQSNSGIIQGTVTDPSKSAIPGAKVRIENPVSHHVSETQTDTDGNFRIPNVPFNPYHLTVTAAGFATFIQDVDVRSTVQSRWTSPSRSAAPQRASLCRPKTPLI